MHAWTKSACVVLAWSVLPLIVMTAGMKDWFIRARQHPHDKEYQGHPHQHQHQHQHAERRRGPGDGDQSPARYVVQPGGSLAGIAARFAVRGGWAALYQANRAVIGPDPNVIRSAPLSCCPADGSRPLHGRGGGHLVRDRGRARRARRLAGPVPGRPGGHRPRPGRDPPGHRADGPAPGGAVTAQAGPGPPAAPGTTVWPGGHRASSPAGAKTARPPPACRSG